MRLATLCLTVTCATLVACGGEPRAEAEDPEASPRPVTDVERSVRIVEPADGATVSGASVRVVFEAEGIEIVPAGEPMPGTGHHHLYVDRDVGEPGSIIPAGQEGILHFGQAQTETELTDLAPGEHRLIAVVADGLHRIFDPPISDTVRIVVREN